MKNLFYPLLFATTLVATACTNDAENNTDVVDPNGKTPISFSVEEGRTSITRAGFTSETKIAMRIKSEKTGSSDVRYTRTVASALTAASGVDYSKISVDEAYVRYWDDAFGRSANLSVFAIAVPGKTSVENGKESSLEGKLANGDTTWFTETTENEKISWTVSTSQDATSTIANEDLTYSNNISENGKDGVYRYDFVKGKYPDYSSDLEDGCMTFCLQNSSETDGPGKFDKGHLIFKHALSRITVNLVKGDGFNGTNDFNFSNGKEVQILSVPVSGTLDLTDGTWSEVTNGDIEMAEQSATSGSNYSLIAQILPDYVISSTATTNVLTFTIDDNQYFITQAQMYDALKSATGMTKKDDTKIIMEQGLNYNFTITVNKTSIISVSAEVEPWADVNAAKSTPSNARITLDGIYDSQSNKYNSSFKLYRLLDDSGEISDTYEGKNWDGDYTDIATLTDNKDNTWSTNWYFESNRAYYHFRTVNTGTDIVTDAAKDYFVISSGSVDSTDPHWGAPMTAEPVYTVSNGYEGTLSPAIGATTENINITDQHMMSNITVKLETTTGNDKVTLAGSKVYITKLYEKGQVQMGNGLVIPTDMKNQLEMDGNTEGTLFTYAVVPQALVRADDPTNDDYVGITIVTGDNNQYYIVKKLSVITAETVSNVKNQETGKAITRWFPGHTYTYTFTLKKTGIDKITCTVQGWVDVTAKNKDISLED